MEPPIKTQKESFQVGKHVAIWGERCTWRGHGSTCRFLIPHPVNLFYLVFLSAVNHSSRFMKPKEGLWKPLIYSQWVRSTRDSLDLPLASEVEGRGSLTGTEP